jgi:hypothetical protein
MQHLLPDATAWRLTIGRTLRRFFEGLAEAPADARAFIDAVFDDAFPATSRELAVWEAQFGLSALTLDADRRSQIGAAWSAQGGQSPSYIQAVLRAAGFDVYVHEWWAMPATDPRVARDPRTYTQQPLIGSTQCGDTLSLCGEPYQQCDRFLRNDVGYLVNLDLTPRAPPPVPDDSAAWPYFIYVCAATFGTKANVPAARRADFERLLLKICPAQQWIVTYVNYV